jgi:hypothetical protein
MLTCSSLRGAVLSSGLLLILGLLVEVIAVNGWLSSVFASYAGLFLLLGGCGLLLVTFLLSLVPANARRLAACEH